MAYARRNGVVQPAQGRTLGALPAPRVFVRSGRRLIPTTPKGTRLFVPGFLSDADQLIVDRSLGIVPIVAVASAIGSLIKSGHFGKELPAVQHAVTLAQSGDAKARQWLGVRGGVLSAIPYDSSFAYLEDGLPNKGMIAPFGEVNARTQAAAAYRALNAGSTVSAPAAVSVAPASVPVPTTATAIPYAPDYSTPSAPAESSGGSWVDALVRGVQAAVTPTPAPAPAGAPAGGVAIQRAGFGSSFTTLALVGLGALVLVNVMSPKRR